jgi:hypothetical protein
MAFSLFPCNCLAPPRDIAEKINKGKFLAGSTGLKFVSPKSRRVQGRITSCDGGGWKRCWLPFSLGFHFSLWKLKPRGSDSERQVIFFTTITCPPGQAGLVSNYIPPPDRHLLGWGTHLSPMSRSCHTNFFIATIGFTSGSTPTEGKLGPWFGGDKGEWLKARHPGCNRYQFGGVTRH